LAARRTISFSIRSASARLRGLQPAAGHVHAAAPLQDDLLLLPRGQGAVRHDRPDRRLVAAVLGLLRLGHVPVVDPRGEFGPLLLEGELVGLLDVELPLALLEPVLGVGRGELHVAGVGPLAGRRRGGPEEVVLGGRLGDREPAVVAAGLAAGEPGERLGVQGGGLFEADGHQTLSVIWLRTRRLRPEFAASV
jgi:hypothetical protein